MLLRCISAVGRTGRESFSGLRGKHADEGNTGRRGKPGRVVAVCRQRHACMGKPAESRQKAGGKPQQRCRTSITAIIVISKSVTAEVAAAWGPNWIA